VVPVRASRIWARAWRLASAVSAATQSSATTGVYPHMYASLAVNRTQISMARPERMRVRTCKKTSKASRVEQKKSESGVYGVGQGDRVDRGRIRSFDAYEGKSGSDPYRNSRLTGHRAKAGFW
jgi:hypothetical protein